MHKDGFVCPHSVGRAGPHAAPVRLPTGRDATFLTGPASALTQGISWLLGTGLPFSRTSACKMVALLGDWTLILLLTSSGQKLWPLVTSSHHFLASLKAPLDTFHVLVKLFRRDEHSI